MQTVQLFRRTPFCMECRAPVCPSLPLNLWILSMSQSWNTALSVWMNYRISSGIRWRFSLLKQPQKSRSILQDGSRSLRLFRKGKTHIIAKFHWTDLVICNHSGDGKPPSYSWINTVQSAAGAEMESSGYLQNWCVCVNATYENFFCQVHYWQWCKVVIISFVGLDICYSLIYQLMSPGHT